jgi:hypothetical protein
MQLELLLRVAAGGLRLREAHLRRASEGRNIND